MRLRHLPFLLLLLAAPLFAQTVEVKGARISIGDPLAKLLKEAGKPDQVRPVPGVGAIDSVRVFRRGAPGHRHRA